MSKKLRLKEMSHKKLRKLCKGLGRQCADYSKENGMLLNSEAKKAEQIGELKKYARSLEQTLASEERRIKDKDKRIKDLEDALDLLGNVPDPNWDNKRDVLKDVQEAIDRAKSHTGYIGEMPANMAMGVDGQLRSFNEMTDVEFATFVAEDVRRAMTEDEPDKVEEYIPKSADVDEAIAYAKHTMGSESESIAWAKRNGHHQPEGNPEPNRMEQVRIKSADEISAENIANHTDMVCNEIAQDKSRILDIEIDPYYDEKDKSHQSLD